jgi:hypothetical protein
MTDASPQVASVPLQRSPRWTKYEKALAFLFLLTVPMVRPWIHGDGRGYYAFARALLFQHNLDFELDWYRGYELHPRVSDPSFRAMYLTPTGHIWNHWTVGPAILWLPFLITARLVMPLVDALRGTHYANDGFSQPYMIAMSLGTLFYGFLALWISLRLARKYVPEHWAFLAVLGIWLATSFSYYLYVEPSFAHTPSAFLTALFVWYWDCTRGNRSWKHWLALGAIAGLMVDTYYPNALVLVLVVVESVGSYWTAWRNHSRGLLTIQLVNNFVFAAAAVLLFLPTLLTKKILWGSYFRTGYREKWYWSSPAFFQVCFSSHGVFSWTPILIPAVIGLYLLRKTDQILSYALLLMLFAFTYFIGCYQWWHATPSFGNRFFISLTIFFILGLATLMKDLGALGTYRRVLLPAVTLTVLLIFWNCGVIYQFAAHLFPQEGEVSWSQVAYNQVAVVPGQVAQLVKASIKERLGIRTSEALPGSQPVASQPRSEASKAENKLTD